MPLENSDLHYTFCTTVYSFTFVPRHSPSDPHLRHTFFLAPWLLVTSFDDFLAVGGFVWRLFSFPSFLNESMDFDICIEMGLDFITTISFFEISAAVHI